MFFLKPTFLLSLFALGRSLNVQERQNGVQGISQQILSPSLNNCTYSTVSPKPFYVIAHRVLTTEGIKIALKDGANALEIDMYAWAMGWWADHDGTPLSSGDTAREMFETIAQEREAGQTVTFVWLDIKNPDWCDPTNSNWRHCSIDALRDLAREILIPAGVRVLYGFDKVGNAYKSIRDNLNDMEALNMNGAAKEVQREFTTNGPADKSKRVMSYGYYDLPFEFGDCKEKKYYTCTELRQAVESDAFGKVFGWTSSNSQSWYVDKLLGEARVDGIIYGRKAKSYKEDKDAVEAAQDILRWLEHHKDRRYRAGQDDSPW